MQLRLDGITQQAGSQAYLYPMSLAPVPGDVTVLLGATQSGKTSLMRIMAGLDRPSAGRVLVDGADVTGMPVRDRDVAMVYQQFINYPSLTVFDNIASPMRLRHAGAGARGRAVSRDGIDARVRALAARLHIEGLLARYPAELSGGQQQRVALARALAKDAPLMLLDEPLVNLDYKLREELRDELTQLFAEGRSTVVYATTEPGEALLLGGYTAVLDAGELLQYGPTPDVFHYPATLRVARAFSDPPMNLFSARLDGNRIEFAGGIGALLPDAPAHGGAVTAGIRAGALTVGPAGLSSGQARDDEARGYGVALGLAVPGAVALAELSGSDTYIHADTPLGGLVAQVPGVRDLALGEAVSLTLPLGQLYLFDEAGARIHAPRRPGRAGAEH